MNEIVLNFSNFINESRRFDDTLTWGDPYQGLFNDFPFEHGILELIKSVDRKWIELKNKYNWGREGRDFPSGHFVMNIKVYNIWPDKKKAEEAMNYSNLSDDELYNWWYRFLNDQREALTDGIDYGWVDYVGFGGKNGGWLVVVPVATDDDCHNRIEDMTYDYEGIKESAKEEDSYEGFVELSDDENYEELVKSGMIDEPYEVQELREEAEKIRTFLTNELEKLQSIDSNLQEVLARVQKFRENGEEWFYDYLREGVA